MLPEIHEIEGRRVVLGLTQEDLSKKTGVSRSSITKLENGKSVLNYSKVKSIFDTLERLEFERYARANFGGLLLKDIQNAPVEYVNVYELVHDVSFKMISKNFSQLPVKDGDKVVGSVTESGINLAIGKDGYEAVNNSQVKIIMGDPFPTVSVNAPVSAVIELLRKYQAILTIDKDKITGIVTNTDPHRKLLTTQLFRV